MVGFTAQYASGSIKVEPSELQDAKFFSPDAMPPIPPRLSIARRLIDAYAQKHGVDLDPREILPASLKARIFGTNIDLSPNCWSKLAHYAVLRTAWSVWSWPVI